MVDEVVTLRDRVLVTVEETERVRVTESVLVPDTVTDCVGTFDGGTEGLELEDTVLERVLVLAKLVAKGLRDTVSERVLVPAKLVGTGLRDTVKLRDLDWVTDTVEEVVGTFDGGTEGLELGDTVLERVLVLTKLVAKGLLDTVKLRDFVRVTDTVAETLASPDGRLVTSELGDTVLERVLVPTKLVAMGLGDLVKLSEMVRDTDTVTVMVGTFDAGMVKRELGDLVSERERVTEMVREGDMVKLRDLVRVRDVVPEVVGIFDAGMVGRELGDTVSERDRVTEMVREGDVVTVTVLVLAKLVAMGLRDLVKLSELVRDTDTVTVMVGIFDAGMLGRELSDTVSERDRVTEMVREGDVVTVTVLVLAKLVAMGLRDLVKLSELVRDTDTVTVMVGRFDGRTEALELGDTVTESVLVPAKLVGMGLRDMVKLSELVRDTDTVTVMVGRFDGRTEGLELGDPLSERVVVGTPDGRTDAAGLRDLVMLRELERVTETVAEGVGTPDGRTDATGLRDMVKLREFVRVTDTVTEGVGRPDGRTDGLALGDTVTERVPVLAKLEGMGLRDMVKLRELERVTETVAEEVGCPDPSTEGWELRDTVSERVRVTEMVGEVV